jgi:hypothetical protein
VWTSQDFLRPRRCVVIATFEEGGDRFETLRRLVLSKVSPQRLLDDSRYCDPSLCRKLPYYQQEDFVNQNGRPFHALPHTSGGSVQAAERLKTRGALQP